MQLLTFPSPPHSIPPNPASPARFPSPPLKRRWCSFVERSVRVDCCRGEALGEVLPKFRRLLLLLLLLELVLGLLELVLVLLQLLVVEGHAAGRG